MAQVKPRLQHCLEQRDRPGILALTTWLVHRHGHPLLQQFLSQPEWSRHRLWWGKQISHPHLDPRPQPSPQPQSSPKTTPTAQDHRGDKTELKTKTPMAAQVTSDPWKTASVPRQRRPPEPEDGLRLDGHSACPANPTAFSEQDRDHLKLTPAQVTKQRLKIGKSSTPAKPVPIRESDGPAPTLTPAARKEQRQRRPHNRKHRSLDLRDWLPRSQLPHQAPHQDAA